SAEESAGICFLHEEDYPLSEFTDRIQDVYDRLLEVGGFSAYFVHDDFWNFGYWNEDTESHLEACENLMEELLAFIPDKKGTILDVACGKGATTRYLLNYYEPGQVTGINISENQLKVCRKNAPGCTFLVMDAATMDFQDHSFDSLICVEA